MSNPFDDLEARDPEEISEPSARSTATRFLPGKASIKDDLQQIYEMEKTIGSIVYKLHTALSHLQATASVGARSSDVTDAVEKILEELDAQHKALLARMDTVDTAHNALATHDQKVQKDWDRLLLAADSVLTDHGYDLKTLAAPAAEVKRLGHWMNIISALALGVIITLVSTWIMSSFSKSLLEEQNAANKVLIQKTQEAIDLMKKQQQELDAHITGKPKGK